MPNRDSQGRATYEPPSVAAQCAEVWEDARRLIAEGEDRREVEAWARNECHEIRSYAYQDPYGY